MGGKVPHTKNHPMIWDQTKLQQEPKWEGPLAAFGMTHGAKSCNELERNLAEDGGSKIPAKDILAMAKGIGMNWKGEHAPKPKLELQHSDSSEHVAFETFLAQHLKEYGACKLMHLQKETLPHEGNPSSKWIPKRGLVLSVKMEESKENTKNQQGAQAMEALQMMLFGGATGTGASGRSLVGIQMQTHKGGPASFNLKRLSDMLEIEFRGAHAQTNGPDWWFRVQMAFLENKEEEPGVNRSYQGKPFLWVDMDPVRHGCREHVEPGRAWKDINKKLLNCIFLRARDVDNHHGIRNDFPLFAAGAMKKKWEDIKQKGFMSRPFLNFNAETEATEDADRWHEDFMLGRRTIVEDGGAQVRTAQEDIDHAPLEMLLQSAQAVFYKD